MDEAARINVWKHTPEYHYGFDGQVYEKDVTYKMSETITNGSTKLCHLRWIGILDTGISWLGLLHQKAIVHKCRPYSINLAHLISDEDVAFEKRNCRNGITKLELRGPEDDPDLEGPQSSPDNNIESLFRDIAALPQLREIAIAPSYYSYSDDTQQLDVSRAIWLLSPESKYTTLRISNLNIMYQADIDNLTEAFATSTSITSLCIETLYIGSSVTKIIPFMQSIAKMPKLTYLRLVMVAFNVMGWNPEPPGVGINYAEDSLQALQTSTTLEGLEIVTGDEVLGPVMGQYFSRNNLREVSNCRSLNADL